MKPENLENLFYSKNSGTIIDPMFEVVRHLHLFPYDKDAFACMSSLAYSFSVNKSLDYQSIFKYNWTENWLAGDFIGIYTKMYSSYTNEFTFLLYQKEMVKKIIASLFAGIPAVIWQDGFVVLKAADMANRMFMICDGNTSRLMPFERLGYSSDPRWCVHLFTHDKIWIGERELQLESLFQAVYRWKNETGLKDLPYASGRRVYDFIDHALYTGHFNKESASATLRSFIEVKKHISRYFERFTELEPIKGTLVQFASLLEELGRELQQDNIEDTRSGFIEARDAENSIYNFIEEMLQTSFLYRQNSLGLR